MEQEPTQRAERTANRLEATFAALPVPLWLADAESLAFTAMTPAAAALFGRTVEAWLADASPWETVLFGDERERVLTLLRATAADGAPRRFVHRVATAPGGERWVETQVRRGAARDGVDAPMREIAGYSVEVQDRREGPSSSVTGEARFRLMLQQVPAVVWTTDRELRFTSTAGAGLAKMGLRSELLVGVNLYQFFQTDDASHANIAPIARTLATGESSRFEAEWLGRVFEAYVEPFREADGTIIGTIGIALDVTDERRVGEERDRLLASERAARASAEEAVRARDEFLSIASHELYTPITSIQLVVQSLLRSARPDEPRMTSMLESAERQVKRLIRLGTQLLDVSRIQAGRLELATEEFDLSALVREVTTLLAQQIEIAKCTLLLDAPAPVRGVWDRSRIEQVVMNLLSNAIKYGPGKPVRISVSQRDGIARLEVEDHGIGIPAARLALVFERFERAVSMRQYGGLGLGLYIVRRIVDAHGGVVHAESVLGEGATFTVDLPLLR